MTDFEGVGFESEPDAFTVLVGAYLDDELAPERRAQVARHLALCAACRRELRAQAAIRGRLSSGTTARASSGLRERIRAGLLTPPVTAPASRPGGRRRAVVLGSGWLAAAALAGVLVHRGAGRAPAAGAPMAMPKAAVPTSAVVLDSVPAAVVDSVLRNFQRVAASDLPGAGPLATVAGAVPFTVPALTAAHMRLLGAWTTAIDGEPVAVLAYRCHDRLVVQYVVSEQQFFRVARIRAAIAAGGLYAAGRDGVHAIAWPGPDNGSLLVGDFSPADLAAMRS